MDQLEEESSGSSPCLVHCKIYSCSKLHFFLQTQLLGMSREFRRGTHALKNLLWPTFQLQAFFGGEKTPLNLGAWKLLPLSRNPGKEVSCGALSGLESKEAAQVWDEGCRNINDDAARSIPSFMGAQPRPGGCAET